MFGMDESNFRNKGLSHCYLDEQQDKFSNVALGLIARSMGFELKVAYFNLKKNIFPVVDLFYKFYFNNLDFFPFNSFEISVFGKYDLVIFDNFSFEDFREEDLENYLKNKSNDTEIVVVCNNKKDFDLIKDRFDLVSEYVYSKNNEAQENLISIYGNGKGKSTFSYGYILRNLMDDNFVKLVYFDKGGNYYGDKNFFEKLRYKNRKFQFYSYGKERFDGNKFRFENIDDDLEEAKYALSELKRSYDEHIIVADELNTCISSKLLNEDEIIKNLKEIKNQILITGRCSSQKLIDLCSTQIEVKEVKHYSKKGFKVRKGIDF